VSEVEQTPRVVVGVVNDVRYGGLDVEPQAEVYIPHAQHPVEGLVMTLRTSGNPRGAIGDARSVLRRLDPNMPLSDVATMEEVVAESVAARRFSLWLLTAFAGVALLLAAIGIYGVLSYTVGQRTKEFGVRMAMGAPRAHVLRLVVAEGMTLVAVGVTIGVLLALGLTSVVRGLLYEVQPYDPPTLAGVGAALVAIALTASYMPARRAASVDPAQALRTE
jgi:putative ABC transport system permease protein